MAFNLGDMLKNVSNLDTGAREQIEYIDIGLIDPDPRNFYSLDGIEELAANIELLGLQQPLRVRDGEGGRVTVVSGYRRLAALKLLAGEGKETFSSAPCIRESSEASEAMRELRLIYANSDTRRLSPAELSKQAERVEALLRELKAEGVEFPGRMRDHVAAACKVSASKLARLKVIREGLTELRCWEAFEEGCISENTAYRLAQAGEEIQDYIADNLDLTELTTEDVDRVTENWDEICDGSGVWPARSDEDESAARREISDKASRELAEQRQQDEADDEEFLLAMGAALKYVASEASLGNSRAECIAALKANLFYRGHGDGAVNFTGYGKGLQAWRPGKQVVCRSWTAAWDALAIAALREIARRAKANE